MRIVTGEVSEAEKRLKKDQKGERSLSWQKVRLEETLLDNITCFPLSMLVFNDEGIISLKQHPIYYQRLQSGGSSPPSVAMDNS